MGDLVYVCSNSHLASISVAKDYSNSTPPLFKLVPFAAKGPDDFDINGDVSDESSVVPFTI